MSEQRLIDANELKICYTGTNGYDDKASYASIRKMIDSRQTIDPETLPIVQELREKLSRYEQAEQEGRLLILSEEDWTWTIRGDIARGIVLANCKAAQKGQKNDGL